MDIQLCAFASLVETVGTAGLRESLNSSATSQVLFLQTFAALFIIQYAIIKTYRIFIYPFWFSPLRHLPSPKGNQFFIGQMLNQFRASNPNELQLEWANQFPDSPFIRYFGLANKETLLLNGVEVHREVFQTNCYSFKKPSLFRRFVGEIAGTGLLFLDGHEHKKQRRMILNVFSIPNMRKMVPVFHERAALMSKFFDKKILESPDKSVEVSSIYQKATIDVVGVTTLGVDLENLKSPILKMDFLECYGKMFEQTPIGALISFLNIHFPVRKILFFVKANRDHVIAAQEVEHMLRALIRRRIKEVNEHKGADVKFESRDLLTYMIEERLDGPDAWTEDEIIGHLRNFLSAGHETTSGSMTWATFALATNPEIQERLRAEVTQLLQEKPNPDYFDIEKLHYMNNFVREVLRCFSPAVATHREAATDVTICGVNIPKGTHLAICPAVTNLSPKIWGPDAETFNPDRWDHLTGDAASPYSVNTFINGPRVCIGKQYAYTEVKSLLIELLSNFRFGMTPELESLGGKMVKLKNHPVVLRPEGGLTVTVERL